MTLFLLCIALLISAACVGFVAGWLVWAIVSGLCRLNTRRSSWENWGHTFGVVGAGLVAIKVGYMLEAAL